MLNPAEIDCSNPCVLTALEMGYEPDDCLASSRIMYALRGIYPVLNALGIDQDDIHYSQSRILYRTTDHGATWEPVGRYVRDARSYYLQWFSDAD